MTARLAYLVATPSPNRNVELDRAARGLGPGAVHLLFASSTWSSASFQASYPEVCPFDRLDAEPRVPIEARLEAIDAQVVVVGGYHLPDMQRAMRWCLAQGVPYALRSDSNIWTDQFKGTLKYWVRHWRLAPWVRRARKVLITGRTNRDFWRRYGMTQAQEAWWPQWIDYPKFQHARTLREQSRPALRAKFGFGDRAQLLYVGRLISLKRLPLLCEALLRCQSDVSLALAGHGPEEGSLRERFGNSLGSRLRFLGRLEPEALPELYAAADALVLPTGPRENWGLVLNEATAAGLPLACHAQVGAAADLLVDGQNGVAFNNDNPASWAQAIDRLVADRGALSRMGHESAKIADGWMRQSEPVACLGRFFSDLSIPQSSVPPRN